MRTNSGGLVPPTAFLCNDNVSTLDALPRFAFAFDIDGVLLRSGIPIPGASQALAFLSRNKIPFILLTNGGGGHESARVIELSTILGVSLTEENFVQSHTPFKLLVQGSEDVESLEEKRILVTGGDGEKCRNVMKRYGFKNVITPRDIVVAHPKIWPFNQISPFTDYYKASSRPVLKPVDHLHISRSLKIDAIFVLNNPRDWALDTQIILDLLFSKNGVLGTLSEKNGKTSLPNNGWQQDGQPKLFFSHSDLFWSTSYHMARLAQGGFQASLQGIWHAATKGAVLERTTIGKPSATTYEYAERVLNKHRTKTFGIDEDRIGRLERVFMVGDNPESDIRGANEFQSLTEWTSILVKTGVHQDGMVPSYKPKAIVHDVLEAVRWACHQEGWRVSIEDV